MKITVTSNVTVRLPIAFSHRGIHLKREFGGPSWWRYALYTNGIVLRLPGRKLLWIELWHPHRSGPAFLDRTRTSPS